MTTHTPKITWQVASLRQHYDKALKDMAAERDALQQERKALVQVRTYACCNVFAFALHTPRYLILKKKGDDGTHLGIPTNTNPQRLHALQHAGEEERATLERRYREQLTSMDAKLRDLQRRERDHAQLETLKARSEDACKRLQGDIQQIKQQKVALHRQMDRANRDFQEWRRSREREIMQLRAQGRRNAVQIQKLELLHSRQQAVLRRKTEEAEAARRRLKEVQLMREGSGVGTRGTQGTEGEVECQPNQHAPLLRDEKARKSWVERELDACCAVRSCLDDVPIFCCARLHHLFPVSRPAACFGRRKGATQRRGSPPQGHRKAARPHALPCPRTPGAQQPPGSHRPRL